MVRVCCSVAQSFLTLHDSMDYSPPGFPVLHYLPELPKLMFVELVMLSNHFILCHPLLLLPSVFLSIRVFSSRSALCIRWPKYWSFSFNISPSSEVLNHFSCVQLFVTPWTIALLCPWDSPGKNTRLGCHAPLHFQ